MKSGAVMGNHYHRRTRVFFHLLGGAADVRDSGRTRSADVDDRSVAHSCQVLRRARHRMPYHDAIRRHCLEISGGIQKCFTLAHAGSGNTDVDSVSGKSLGRDFEGGASTGRRFEEEVDNSAAAQRGYFLDLATGDIAKCLSRVEQVSDFAGLKFPDAE